MQARDDRRANAPAGTGYKRPTPGQRTTRVVIDHRYSAT